MNTQATSSPGRTGARENANARVYQKLCEAEPVLEDVAPARDVVPGFSPRTILTSGPPLAWSDYQGGQRAAILGAVRYEGLAGSEAEAEDLLAEGEVEVHSCHDFGCIGSLAGVYSASMPVFVVRNTTDGNMAFCNFYEGSNPRRLNYGVYDEDVHARLVHTNEVIAPVVGDAVRAAGGIALKPIMQRALHMGDELHSRNTAASLLFSRMLFPALLTVVKQREEGVNETIELLTEDNYFFLRLSMAAAKATADSARDIDNSSLVTAMAINCRHFGIRVSGLGDAWYLGPHPQVDARLFEGYTEADIQWMGGDSTIAETVGLGGFAQAAAFPLQSYQGGTAEAMVELNLSMYQITHGEHTDFQIPFLGYRGTPTGIDIFRVVETGIVPVMDIGIAGRNGGQIGAGIVRAPEECFEAALAAFRTRYPETEAGTGDDRDT